MRVAMLAFALALACCEIIQSATVQYEQISLLRAHSSTCSDASRCPQIEETFQSEPDAVGRIGHSSLKKWNGHILELQLSEASSIAKLSFTSESPLDTAIISIPSSGSNDFLQHIPCSSQFMLSSGIEQHPVCVLMVALDGKIELLVEPPLPAVMKLQLQLLAAEGQQYNHGSDLEVFSLSESRSLESPRRVVRQSPGDLSVMISPASIFFVEGSNVTSVCNATTGQITSNVTWAFSQNPVPESQVFQSGEFGEIITYVNLTTPTMIPGAPIVHLCTVVNNSGAVLATSNPQAIIVDLTNCLNENYCLEVRNIPNSACTNIIGTGTESCLCLVGFGPENTCANLDECSLGTHNCSALGGNCTDTFGSFQCACLAGFSGDGFNCMDIDECAPPSPCDTNATCNNTVGSFTCTCNPGYNGTGFVCGDLNECLVGAGPCDTNAMCANTVGSFACACNSGFTGTGLVCNDVNECLVVPGPCNANATCTNTIGSFTCTCNPGFNGTGFVCEDLNECLVGAGPCDTNARCNNTIGSFTCTCIAGYTGNGFVCNDVNECLIGPGPCNANATCNNTIGSFTCTCNASFNGNGIICEDVNECMLVPGPCAPNATCTNVVGSFSCMCNPGFTGDGLTCVNIVECDNMPCDVNARCTDTIGSFICLCNPGFSGAGVGSNSCADIDECIDGPHNCSAVGGTCTNVMGSFSCACAMGFSGNGLQCADVDECQSGSRDCSEFASCTNTVGSFICACLTGYTGTGQMCRDTDECLQLPPACPSTNQLCLNMAGTFRCDCESGFYANDSSNCITVSNLLEGFVPPVAPSPSTLTWTITRFPDTSLINYRIVVVDLGTDPSTVDFSESPGFTYANGANVLTYEQVRDQTTFSTPRAAYYAAVFTFGSGQTMQFTAGADMMTTSSGVRNGPLVSGRSYTIFYEASAAAFTSRRKRQTTISGIRASVYQPVQRTANEDDDDVNVGAIVGGVIGGIIALLLIGLIILLIIQHRRQDRYQSRTSFRRAKRDEVTGDLSYVNPMVHDQRAAIEMSGTASGNADFYQRMPTKNFDEDTLKRGSIKVADFPDHCQGMKANDGLRLSREYALIVKRAPALPASVSEANRDKNRYANILAADSSRVLLDVDDEEKPGNDYVNANYVDGYRYPKEYIASQGPLATTTVDFWRMVWQCNVRTISMVTNLEEKTKKKCDQYWPKEAEDTYGDITVSILETVEQTDFVVRTMQISNNRLGATSEDQTRIVKQFHFTAWPDFGAPSVSPLLNYLRRLRFHQSHESTPRAPIIIHCSAGVGRTGTLITIDAMINRAKAESSVDVFNAVTILRTQRQLMVQTEMQYVFIHDALLEALTASNTEVSAGGIHAYIKELEKVTNGQALFEEEYRKLPIGFTGSLNCTSAFSTHNIKKNRKANIVPYDRTRVKLVQRPGDHGSDYVNASFLDGYTTRRAFIATQGPLAHTAADFWRMIWEHDVGTIVMLCEQKENGVETCSQYWPLRDSEPTTYENFLIRLGEEMSMYDNKLRDRELLLTNTTEKQFRKVRHLQYVGMEDDRLPQNGSGILDLIGRVQGSQQSSGNNPIVVHDSVGVGRSGVFCALTTAIERLKMEGCVDIFQTVKIMRTQRMGLVANPEQYFFIYTTILEYLDSFDTYANFK